MEEKKTPPQSTIKELLTYWLQILYLLTAVAIILDHLYLYKKTMRDYQIDVGKEGISIFDNNRLVGSVKYEDCKIDDVILRDNQ